MYAIRVEVDPRLQTNPVLREYARLEYGKEDLSWFLAAAGRSSRRVANRAPTRRFPLFRRRPSHQPVACKGTPRWGTTEGTASA